MTQLDVLTARDGAAWERVLDACAPHDFYHLPGYHALAEDAGEGAARLFVFARDGYTVALPLLLRPIDPGLLGEPGWLDATSVYGYAGPVASHPALPEAIVLDFQEALVDRLRALRVVTVFSRLHPLLPQRPLLTGLGEFRVSPTVAIDLTAPDDVQYAQMRANHRRGISKLRRSGAAGVRDGDWAYLPEFCRVYDETMRRVRAAEHYFFPPAYFEGLRRALGPRLHLFVCRREGRVLAAGLFTSCHGMVQYHLSGTATDALPQAPAILLLDEARIHFARAGMRVLHLGGGTTGRPDDSLLRFKLGFSDQTCEFAAWRGVVYPEAHRRLCARKALDDERHGRAPANPDFFPAYRCPAAPRLPAEPAPAGAGRPPGAAVGGAP